MQSLRALMPLPTSLYICEFMQVGEFLDDEEEQAQQVVQFNISLHAISKLYWSRGSRGEVVFFTDNESAPRGQNIAFSVSGEMTSALFERLVRNLQSNVNLFLKL